MFFKPPPASILFLKSESHFPAKDKGWHVTAENWSLDIVILRVSSGLIRPLYIPSPPVNTIRKRHIPTRGIKWGKWVGIYPQVTLLLEIFLAVFKLERKMHFYETFQVPLKAKVVSCHLSNPVVLLNLHKNWTCFCHNFLQIPILTTHLKIIVLGLALDTSKDYS